jgi:Asp-tRNA(Asn)/Glu-tRNA(Gln) amidotransferase A subunit family amidase
VTSGCLSRSVRDTARWFDVCNGFDPRDTLSLPRVDGWEEALDSFDLRGMRAVVALDLGGAIVDERQLELLDDRAEQLIAAAGLRRVDVDVDPPVGGTEWALANLSGLAGLLGDRYPDCHDDLTAEVQLAMEFATERYSLRAVGAAEIFRILFNETMADLFEQTDFIFAATNPDVAFNAAGPLATTVGDVDLIATYGLNRALANNGALTFPANLAGGPAVTIPSGEMDGLPIGLQVLGRHHEDQLLLDLARVAEREFPWPLTAPASS